MGGLAHCGLVALSYDMNYIIDCLFRQTRNTFEVYHFYD